MTKIKPCPFCGNQPTIDNAGTYTEISCCTSISLQKSDYLVIGLRETWDKKAYVYSKEAEDICSEELIRQWNKRYVKKELTPQQWWDIAPWQGMETAPNSTVLLKFQNGYIGEGYKCQSGEFYLSGAQQRCNDACSWLPIPIKDNEMR